MVACVDRRHGGNPKLFDVPRGKGGAPNQVRSAMHGILAGIVDILMESGLSLPDACFIVAAEAGTAGVRNARGKPPSQDNIEDWRDTIEAPSLAAAMRAEATNLFRQRMLDAIGAGDDPLFVTRDVLATVRTDIPGQ